MVAPNPYAPFKAREDGRVAVLPVENPRLRRPRTCPRGEGTYTFSAAPGTEGNYLDEVWTLDKRSGGVTVADLNDGNGSDRHFYHQNTLYHVYALTDETGALAEAVQSYDAYGKISALITGAGTDTTWFTSDDVLATNPNVSTIGNPFFYTGQRVDPETGLYYYKNRYYSAELGRYLARDPRGYIARILSLYEYVLNCPTSFLDPYGLENERYVGPENAARDDIDEANEKKKSSENKKFAESATPKMVPIEPLTVFNPLNVGKSGFKRVVSFACDWCDGGAALYQWVEVHIYRKNTPKKVKYRMEGFQTTGGVTVAQDTHIAEYEGASSPDTIIARGKACCGTYDGKKWGDISDRPYKLIVDDTEDQKEAGKQWKKVKCLGKEYTWSIKYSAGRTDKWPPEYNPTAEGSEGWIDAP